jgi:hypothetical protein
VTYRPTLGVVAGITNPLTTGYLAYLAFVGSWSKVADEVVLVDGGSNDGSIEFLEGWTVLPRNVHIVSNDLTFWGAGEHWHIDQSSINLTIGIASLHTDWVLPTGADHVLDLRTAEKLFEELSSIKDIAVATCYRGKPGQHGINHRMDVRTPFLNLRLLRHQGIEPVLGVDLQRGLRPDYPLYPQKRSYFTDSVTGVRKKTYGGREIPLDGRAKLSAEVISYGHFFFTPEQCLRKLRRWDLANARFQGIAPKRDLELKLLNGLHSIQGFRSKEEIMTWDQSPEIMRVIDRFYKPDMLGGAIREVSGTADRAFKILRKVMGLERRLRTYWMRGQGYRGLKDLHQWVPLDAPDPDPLDMAKVYTEQDRLLPIWAHLTDSHE